LAARSGLLLSLETERQIDQGDGCAQQCATHSIKESLGEPRGHGRDSQGAEQRQTRHGSGKDRPRISHFHEHRPFSPKGSIGAAIPEKQHVLHDEERRDHHEQVAAHDVIMKPSKKREADGEDSARHACVARGASPVVQKSLIYELGKRDTHFVLASEKMSSVDRLNTRANVNASGKLGT
jgi:hypothetical protein